MARTADDLFTLEVALVGTVSLDWERVEGDPMFRTLLATSESLEDALQQYLVHYVKEDVFLRNAPSTNGPGHLVITGLRKL